MRPLRTLIAGAAVLAAAAVAVDTGLHDRSTAVMTPASHAFADRVLPTVPGSYLGVYAPPAPDSYSGVAAFSAAVGVRPSCHVLQRVA